MRRHLKILLATMLGLASVQAVFATTADTWKLKDLYVKRNLYVAGHILTGQPSDGAAVAYFVLPTIAAGTGAGTSPTVAISGNDTAGKISVTTGSSPTASAVVATITFGTPWKTNSFVILTPGNAATQALAVAAQSYPTSTTTTFALNSGASGLAASTAYVWNYHVFGN